MDFQGKKNICKSSLVCLCLAVQSVVFKSLSSVYPNPAETQRPCVSNTVYQYKHLDSNNKLHTPIKKKLQHESELCHNPTPKQAQNHKNPESRTSAFHGTNAYSNTFLSITTFSGCFSFPKHLNYYISGGQKEMGWNADLI